LPSGIPFDPLFFETAGLRLERAVRAEVPMLDDLNLVFLNGIPLSISCRNHVDRAVAKLTRLCDSASGHNLGAESHSNRARIKPACGFVISTILFPHFSSKEKWE
jgi:hypothetical protein